MMHINRWGHEHESHAYDAYSREITKLHKDFEISKPGFFIDVTRPYVGTTPDRIISCFRYGKGVLEIKCPYCYKESLPSDDDEAISNYCMMNENGHWKLKRDHAYYYQVQMQMAVCQLKFCDFVVWSEKDYIIERITFDVDFYASKMDKVQNFFVYGMLPEILGKWYTRKPVANSDNIVQVLPSNDDSAQDDDQEDYTRLWCYCSAPSFGRMICCDNDQCLIKWFHFDCLRIRSSPKGKWYCPSCCKLPQFSKGKSKKTK